MHFKEGGVQPGVFGCMKVFGDFVTQYCELHDETTCTGKSADAAFRCVKNQLATRSGSLCGDKSVFGNFGKIRDFLEFLQKVNRPYLSVERSIRDDFYTARKRLSMASNGIFFFSNRAFYRKIWSI